MPGGRYNVLGMRTRSRCVVDDHEVVVDVVEDLMTSLTFMAMRLVVWRQMCELAAYPVAEPAHLGIVCQVNVCGIILLLDLFLRSNDVVTFFRQLGHERLASDEQVNGQLLWQAKLAFD